MRSGLQRWGSLPPCALASTRKPPATGPLSRWNEFVRSGSALVWKGSRFAFLTPLPWGSASRMSPSFSIPRGLPGKFLSSEGQFRALAARISSRPKLARLQDVFLVGAAGGQGNPPLCVRPTSRLGGLTRMSPPRPPGSRWRAARTAGGLPSRQFSGSSPRRAPPSKEASSRFVALPMVPACLAGKPGNWRWKPHCPRSPQLPLFRWFPLRLRPRRLLESSHPRHKRLLSLPLGGGKNARPAGKAEFIGLCRGSTLRQPRDLPSRSSASRPPFTAGRRCFMSDRGPSRSDPPSKASRWISLLFKPGRGARPCWFQRCFLPTKKRRSSSR